MAVILVTNDDGIGSRGLRKLAKALLPVGDVYIVAPEREQSAVGHALTLHRPLRFKNLNKKSYFINGTPTDCIILGVNRLLPQKPDIIVSGINHGSNMGDDITYSGTVAAAIEGTLLGIPSIAVSLALGVGRRNRNVKEYAGLHEAARFIQKLTAKVLKDGLPSDTLLNVNIPDIPKVRGVKLTRQGKRTYDNSIHDMTDPRGRKHYWIGGGTPLWHRGGNTDFEAIQEGFISITPVHLDLTNYDALKYLTNKRYIGH